MSFSYSRVDMHHTCPYQYKLVYIDKLKAKEDDSPNNALFLGTSIHEGIEKRSIEHALEVYKSKFKDLDERHDIEMIKLSNALDIAINKVPHGEYEYKLSAPDGFIGYIDLLVKVDDGVYDLYDFKHSNNIGGYLKSCQVHLYKYYFEKLTGNKVRDLYYVFIPKVSEILSDNITKDELIAKIKAFYKNNDINFQKVEYDKGKIGIFFARKALMDKDKIFEKRYSSKCSWCLFQKYCSTNGKDRSELIENEGEESDAKTNQQEEKIAEKN